MSSCTQVDVQLTVRLQGTALLRFGTAAADAVLSALTGQVLNLNELNPALQQIAHFACPDPRRQGIGCRLSPQQLASGESWKRLNHSNSKLRAELEKL